MARPQETRRKVEEQRDPPGELERTLDVAERRRHIRRVDDERGIRRARAATAADIGEPLHLRRHEELRKLANQEGGEGDPQHDRGRSAET